MLAGLLGVAAASISAKIATNDIFAANRDRADADLADFLRRHGFAPRGTIELTVDGKNWLTEFVGPRCGEPVLAGVTSLNGEMVDALRNVAADHGRLLFVNDGILQPDSAGALAILAIKARMVLYRMGLSATEPYLVNIAVIEPRSCRETETLDWSRLNE